MTVPNREMLRRVAVPMTEMPQIRSIAEHRVLANALRMLAVDAVEQAKSGHPGAPLGMADIAEVLWNRYLKHNPADPHWPDRDRFVLSNGHGSMLLYALLHLSGYDLPLDELKRFRQLHSRTPGHPETGLTPGVETTTGPLGQGIANAVGMALAEKLLAEEFNRANHTIIDHRTFAFVGDGCLMEGISHEACSLAGTLGLEKLVVFYDDNGISIDGQVGGWFADDTPARFEAYGWRVIRDVDGHDSLAIDEAIQRALQASGKPTLVCCKTVIGWGAPKLAGSHEVHGAPLGTNEVAGMRGALGWTHPAFQIPEPVRARWDSRSAGERRQHDWERRVVAYAVDYPAEAAEFQRRMARELPANFEAHVAEWIYGAARAAQSVATRQASQLVIEALAPVLPELVGGSADLTGSNLTNWKASRAVGRHRGGNYIHYGVREFGMTAIMNGMALHGGFIPFGGTFLVFSDYARSGLRMAALMRLRAIFVLTHDSIGLGEDGPTHQPVEHASSLRLIPNMDVWRPCDLLETAVAWKSAIERLDGPTSLLLSRQTLSPQPDLGDRASLAARGGYVLADGPGEKPDVVVIATGSEVTLAMSAREMLSAQGLSVRVVSMPSTTVFDRQDTFYRRSVLSDGVRRIAVEAGVTSFWWKYVGLDGAVIGIDSFGESAPAAALFRHFGLTADRIAETACALCDEMAALS
jgi:transketolase